MPRPIQTAVKGLWDDANRLLRAQAHVWHHNGWLKAIQTKIEENKASSEAKPSQTSDGKFNKNGGPTQKIHQKIDTFAVRHRFWGVDISFDHAYGDQTTLPVHQKAMSPSPGVGRAWTSLWAIGCGTRTTLSAHGFPKSTSRGPRNHISFRFRIIICRMNAI